MIEVDIKKLTKQDLPFLIPLMRQTWEHSYPDYCKNEKRIFESLFLEEKISADINNLDYVFLGAFYQDKCVGYAKVVLKEPQAFLDKLYVLPEFCGQQIGQKLLHATFQTSLNKGLDCISLHVDEKNERAKKFYEKHGFVSQPIKDLFPSLGPKRYYGIIMECNEIKLQLQKDNPLRRTSHGFFNSLQRVSNFVTHPFKAHCHV